MTGLIRVVMERVKQDGRGAEQPELLQVAGDLVHGALTCQPVLTGNGLAGEPQHDTRREFRYRPLLLTGRFLQPPEGAAYPRQAETQRMPRVAQADRAPDSGIAVAADPDRDLSAGAVVVLVCPGGTHRLRY